MAENSVDGGNPLHNVVRHALSASVSSSEENDISNSKQDDNDGSVSLGARPLTEQALGSAGLSSSTSRWDAYDLSQPEATSPVMSHTASEVSDRLSTISGLTSYFPKHPLNIRPAPAYVASLGASQVVSENKAALGRRWSDEEDDENGARKSDVQFSQPALALINTFLDQLLYSFLASASSTSLNALRPAVTEVLKSKLARESIASAEEELSELLAGGDDEEEMESRHKAAEHDRKWDLELVWKRTRLRVMVYTRLGEMEDEDEERYVQEEELFHGNEQRFSQSTGLVSWASAIFLTSVIEYIAEQTLQIAGKAAFTRARRKERSQPTITGETANAPTSPTNVLVEEYDVEKVALNSTLGRLWRTWRKAQRNSMNPASLIAHSRNVSNTSNKRSSFATANEGSVRSLHSSHPSTATMPEGEFSGVQSPGPEIDYPEHVLAANIPLPMVEGTRDVDEIETPWLAKDPDAEELTPTVSSSARRNTYTGLSLPSPDVGDPFVMSNFVSSAGAKEQRPQIQRQRSRSVPTMPGAAFSSADQNVMPGAVTSSNEEDVMPGSFPVDSETVSRMESEQVTTTTTAENSALDSSQVGQTIKDTAKSTTTEGVLEDAAASRDVNGEPAVTSDHKLEESDSQSGGVVAAAAAAAVAAVGAGAAAIGYGAKEENVTLDDNTKSRDIAETSENATQPNGEPVVTAATPVEPHGMDERKSLADIKSLIAATPAPAPSGDVSPPSPSSRRLSSYTRETRPLSYGSVSSLGSKEQSFHSISARRESGVSAIDASEVQARPPSKATTRSNRLVIGTSPPPSPGRESAADRGHRVSASIDDETQRIASRGIPSPNEQTRFAHRQTPSGRSNGPGKSSEDAGRPSIALSAVSGSSRHDPSAAQEPGSPRKPRLTGMMKSKTSPSPEPPITSLTSASIRGPEDFDMFVQAVETVKYTLTPDNVRDDTERPRSRDVPMLSAASSKKQQPLPPLDTRPGRAVPSKQPASAVVPAPAPAVKQEVQRSVSRPAPRNARSVSRSGHQAREPRVQTESTRDFADFIRSTGPDKAPTVYPMLSNPSATSLHSLRTAHINGASATASAAASAAASRSGSPGPHDRASSMGTTRSFGGASKAPPLPPIPAQNRKSTTMQARDATASTTRNSELIDFIRSGPDERGKHRIPRNVAPFRTTMDSDQFRELAERGSMDQHADAPFGTAGSSAMSVQTSSSLKGNSARTSVNSRSALLNSSAAGTAAPAVQQPTRNTSTLRTLETNSNDPTRTRVRNKDPYSTDFVDEDDDDEEQEQVDQLAALPGKERQQESLMDFLRNSEPPTSSSSSAAGPSAGAGGRPISSSTTPRPTSMHASRSGAATPTGPPASVDPSGRARTMPASPRSASMRSSNPGIGSASSVRGGPRMEARSPVSGIGGGDGRRESRLSSLNSAAGGGGAGGASNRTATADLADFLKNSGPVEDPDSAPAPSIGKAPKLSPKEAEKLRKREEKLRAKENRKASRPASAAGSGGSGGGFFSAFSMRRKTHLEVS